LLAGVVRRIAGRIAGLPKEGSGAMNLQDFISTTLQQVISGVEGAQAKLGEKGKLINAPG